MQVKKNSCLMNYKLYFILILFAIVTTLNSCDERTLYSENKKIISESWGIADSVIFKATIFETENFCNVFIDVDIKETFLTNNLWLFISVESPSGNIQNDTIMYYIADETGKWFGKEKRPFIENKFIYKPYIKFPDKGEYIFIIKHGMREKDIPMVKSIGITVEIADISEKSEQ